MIIEEITFEEYEVELINSIQKKYPKIRQESKAITFAAQYGGTFRTFMDSGGFSEPEAKKIESNYEKLYQVSSDWAQGVVSKGNKFGYVTVAFGLRVRTPILKKSILNSRVTTSHAAAEGRTVGNASQQSYGLLNNRAFKELMQKVRLSQFREMFRPCALIHDAIYGYVKDDWEALTCINNTLTKAMEWQELPEIAHPEVKLGGDLDIFYPTWKDDFTLPRAATVEQIQQTCLEEMQKRSEAD